MRLDGADFQRMAAQRAQEAMAPQADLRPLAYGAQAFTPPTSFSLLGRVPYVPAQRDQGDNGNCWVWASTAMTEVALSTQYQITDRLSIQYFDSNKTDSFAGNGGNLSEFCNWYTNTSTSNNLHPGVLVPWSNPNGGYVDAGVEGYLSSSVLPAGSVGMVPCYSGVTMAPAAVLTYGQTQAQAIANIQAALLANQAVGFSFTTNFDASDGFDAFWDAQPESVLWQNHYESQTYDGSTWGAHMVTIVGYDASDTVNPANQYWLVLNSWGTTAGRSTGLFRMPMHMNYSATYNYPSLGLDRCYWFETLSLPTLAVPAPAVPAAAISAPAQAAQVGQSLTLGANVLAGSPPITYQWSLNGVAIPGATSASYTLPYLIAANDGQTYRVQVGNATGSVTLGPAPLRVLGTQLLQDPDFEEGNGTTAWTWTGTSAPFVSDTPISHSGSWYYRQSGISTLTSKPFTVPPTSDALYISYWLQSLPLSGSPSSSDSLAINLVAGDGSLVRNLARYQGVATNHQAWTEDRFDISNLKGSTLAIQIVCTEPNGTVVYRLDDIGVVSVCPDLNGDSSVDVMDMARFASAYGINAAGHGFLPLADLNNDGVIDEGDITLFMNSF